MTQTTAGLSWSTHELAEYFVAVCAQHTVDAAIQVAVERAAEALDAEVGAAVIGGAVERCYGLPPGTATDGLLSVAAGRAAIALPGLATVHACASRLERGSTDALVLGRLRVAFSGEERQMLQGMAQVLGLALRSLRTVEAERTLLGALRGRQRLLETLLEIQRAISNRRPLEEVLAAVTGGASRLLDGAEVALLLTDPYELTDQPHPSTLIQASTSGLPAAPGVDTEIRAAAITAIMAARRDGTGPSRIGPLLTAVVGVDNGIAGCLVARTGPHSPAEDRLELLAAFAQQVSLALTDARTVEAMREAYHDPLTALPNRTLFLDRLQHALVAAHRRDEKLTVLFVDLDRFKAVNDSLGHGAGDELLAAAASRIRGCLRDADTAARLGGDEFAVLLEGTSADGGVLVANRIIETLTAPFRISDRDVVIAASIGVAQSARPGMDANELLSNADVAMYKAKKAGTGQATIFEARMQAEIVERLGLQADLRHALPLGQLELHYQPMVRLDTGAPVAVEALLRWNHPQLGDIPRSVLIPLAEETGLIVEIGRWVMRTGAARTVEWRRTMPGLSLSVNVSPRQVIDRRLAADTAEILRDTTLPAAALTLELTETALVTDPVTAGKNLNQIKALGARIALDDFGTGYSSLSYLREYPVDQVKIDRGFTAGICANTEDLAVVRAVLDLGRSLRLQTIAEGIEEPNQFDRLVELGCDLGQGYQVCPPLAEDVVGYHLAALAQSALTGQRTVGQTVPSRG
jgi:diguanylate cyclase (GGDEF)-like protein